MSSFNWPSIGSGGGVPIYSSIGAFPAGSVAGDLGVAADTGFLYEWSGSAWQVIGGPGVSLSLAAFGSTPNANGLSLSGNALNMQPADGTHPGGVSILAQTFAGIKTFSSAPNLSSLSASLPLQLDASKNVTAAAIDLSGSQATGVLAAGRFPALTGDITTVAGALATTLATVNSNVGSFTVASLTVNAKGLVTAVSSGTTGNLTDVGTDGITITSGTGAVLGSGTSISQHVSDTTHNGYLSSTDWNTFNSKASEVLPATNQMVYVNFLTGSDSTGTGAYDKPYQTVAHAMTTITDATSNKPYVVALQAARQIESTDVFMKPYTFICGLGQRATYMRINGGGALKPDTSHSTANSWVGLFNLYWGGSSPITWDLQALGGSNCVFLIQNCTITGTFQYKGRGGGGGDFLEAYVGITTGSWTLDSVGAQIQSIEFGSTLSVTDTQATGATNTFNNAGFDANVTIASVANTQLNNIYYASGVTLTTTGTCILTSYRGLPPTAQRTFSGGTTVTNLDNATIVPYTPAVSGNWSSVPTNDSVALDNLASTGIYKSQTANTIFAAPSGSSGLPTFRAITTTDLPTITLTGDVTGAASGGSIATTYSGTVPVNKGGTGLVSITAHDLLVGNGTSAATLVAPSSTSGVPLVSNGSAADPSFGQLDLSSSSAVKNALGATNGGTAQSTYATGDLLYASATNTLSKLTIGSSSNVLTVSGGVPVWQAAAAAATTYAPNLQKFTSSSGTYGNSIWFTITSGSATAGATYTNNAQTFTVVNTVASATTVLMTSTGAPASSGTLTKATGTGDSTLTFSAFKAPLYIRVVAVGGGGGGGGSGVNGTGTTGGSGGTTTFGSSLITCTGGQAGGAGGNSQSGGTATLNSPAIGIALKGAQSGASSNYPSTTNNIQLASGSGGCSPLGGAGGGVNTGSGDDAGANTGSGGAGGGSGIVASASQGPGGGAGAYIDAIITSPSATYAYAVGAAGTAGAAGSGGGQNAGGAGGSGLVVVYEYFQ